MKSPSHNHSEIRNFPCWSTVRFGLRSCSQLKTMKNAPARPAKFPDTAPKAVPPIAQAQQTPRNFHQYPWRMPVLSP